jgi:hypothetical protein
VLQEVLVVVAATGLLLDTLAEQEIRQAHLRPKVAVAEKVADATAAAAAVVVLVR